MISFDLYSESPHTPFAPVLGFPTDFSAVWDTVYTMVLNAVDSGKVCEIRQRELIINAVSFDYQYSWKSGVISYTNEIYNYEMRIEMEKNCLCLLSIQGYLNDEKMFIFRKKKVRRTNQKIRDIYQYSGKSVLEEKFGNNANAALALLCWWVMCRDTED